VTLLVCSSCHAPLADTASHCPRCGPGSLVLIAGEHLPVALPTPPDVDGARLGRALGSHYRVVRLIGRGGFAEVYEVLDTDLARRLPMGMDLPPLLSTQGDEAATESIPAARSSGRRARWAAVAGIAAATLLAALTLRPRAELVVRNGLTEAIAITVDDTGLTISSGDSVHLPVRAGRPFEARWALVRPTAASGGILGEALEGSLVATARRGATRRVVNAGHGSQAWFAPIVVNRTSDSLSATVVTQEDSIDCRCRVGPGETLRLGYYRLVPNSAIRVVSRSGRVARFTDLPGRRDSLSGAIILTVDSSSIGASHRQSTRRAAPQPKVESHNPLRGILPVR
jgi:serine/threonine protein kinase